MNAKMENGQKVQEFCSVFNLVMIVSSLSGIPREIEPCL